MSEPTARIFLSVPTVSTAEPERVSALAAVLAGSAGVRLIHVGREPGRGRSSFTLLGELDPLLDALVELALSCDEDEDGSPRTDRHLDTVSLVALHPAGEPADAAAPARRLMERLAQEAGLWCAAHGAASSAGPRLAELRGGGREGLRRRIASGEVEGRAPEGEAGEGRQGPGLTFVVAHPPLVRLRVELATGALRTAERLAERLAASAAVAARAFEIGQDSVEIALDLTDLSRTDLSRALDWVESLAAEEGVGLGRAELLGCLPRSEWRMSLPSRVSFPGLPTALGERRILEAWLPGGALADDPGLKGLDEELRPPAESSSSEPAPAPAPSRETPPPRLRLLDIPLEEAAQRLSALLRDLGEPSYRSGQVLNAIWKRRRRSLTAMTELPKALRASLEDLVQVPLLEMADRRASVDGTVKYLWRCADGSEVESVSIPTERRTTFCLSSQVGCTLKCRFCATGYLGFGRNLGAGEILDQVLGMLADLELSAESLNVVFMGMGEPGHNMGAVLQAVRSLNDPAGLGVGARRITVSTSGVVAAIRQLAAEPIQLRLALSLHAADQGLRESLMSIAEKHTLDELAEACQAYHHATRRRITLEYCVIPGVNESALAARRLAAWARRIPSKINLIPYNPVAEYRNDTATPQVCRDFRAAVVGAGYPGEVLIRETRGRDIEAACGMLHRHRAEAAGSAPA